MGILTSILAILGLSGNIQDDSWILAQGTDSGLPLLVRTRSEVPSGINPRDYKYLLTIIWNYQPNENGMPNPQENQSLENLENATDTLIEKKKIAFMTHVFTGNGKREWNWYTNNKKRFLDALNGYLVKKDKFPIKISEEEDPNWNEWKGILALANKK